VGLLVLDERKDWIVGSSRRKKEGCERDRQMAETMQRSSSDAGDGASWRTAASIAANLGRSVAHAHEYARV